MVKKSKKRIISKSRKTKRKSVKSRKRKPKKSVKKKKSIKRKSRKTVKKKKSIKRKPRKSVKKKKSVKRKQRGGFGFKLDEYKDYSCEDFLNLPIKKIYKIRNKLKDNNNAEYQTMKNKFDFVDKYWKSIKAGNLKDFDKNIKNNRNIYKRKCPKGIKSIEDAKELEKELEKEQYEYLNHIIDDLEKFEKDLNYEEKDQGESYEISMTNILKLIKDEENKKYIVEHLNGIYLLEHHIENLKEHDDYVNLGIYLRNLCENPYLEPKN